MSLKSIARPKNRARIETFDETKAKLAEFAASPGLKTGRGLKR